MPSAAEIWKAVLETDEVGDWQRVTVTSVATGENATSTIFATELINNDPDFDDSAYNGWFAYVETTGEQRRVRQSGGFTASTGRLLLNAPLANILPVGAVVWLMRRIGVTRYQSLSGLIDAANAALEDLAIEEYLVIDGETVAPNGSVYEIEDDGTVDLSDLPWLTLDRILGVRRATATNEISKLVPGQPHLRRNLDAIILEPQIELGSGDTLTLNLARPSRYWIKLRKRATGTITLNAGAVSAIAVLDGGAGYASAPTVTIYGGGGSGATATAQINADGEVTGFTVTGAGSGYTSAPSLFCSAPTGGEFADSAVGLANDDDVCVPPLDYMTPATLYHAAVSLKRGPGEDAAYWDLQATKHLAVSADAKGRHEPTRERADDLMLEDADGSIDERDYSWP